MQICTTYVMLFRVKNECLGEFIMSERLPGTLQERLRELREEHGFSSRNKLADVLGVDRTTYSRIENGTTKTISSDMLIKLAELYDVSTDYILGISNTPEKTYYDIGELGLSVDAATNLMTGKVSSIVVNELLENDKFATATKMMKTYFCGGVADMLKEHNALLDMNYDNVFGLVKDGSIDYDQDAKDLLNGLKAEKIPVNKFELDKIQTQLMSAVKEVKKNISEKIDYDLDSTKKLNSDALSQINSERLKEISAMDKRKQRKFVKDTMYAIVDNAEGISDNSKKWIRLLIDKLAPWMEKFGR